MENAGFGMDFQTMPFLFQQWGEFMGAFAGVLWFGLLFFAGITSSLAMGTPWMGFMKDEFGWNKNQGAWSFGLVALLMGLPTVLFYQQGVFEEYDYWAGTVSLVVFALLEAILFSWVFGINKGWREINEGSDIRIPLFYKFIIKYITPLLLLLVFISALITPENNEWTVNILRLTEGQSWQLDNGSIIRQISHYGLKEQWEAATQPEVREALEDKMFYSNFARMLLLGLFLFISFLVYLSHQKRQKEGRIKI
jgi:hypothetical protein